MELMSIRWSYFGRVAREGREMITGVNPNPKRMSLTMTQTLMGRQSFSSAARMLLLKLLQMSVRKKTQEL
jgi:hypothetical protein